MRLALVPVLFAPSALALVVRPPVCAQPAVPAAQKRSRVVAQAADYSGSWEMDLAASDALGPVLREMSLNRVLAALVSRLAVRQTIAQDADKVSVTVKTALSTDEFELRWDGALTQLPGLTGGWTAAASRWLEDGRLETRQHLAAEASGRPDAPEADAFETVRSLHDGGQTLWEEVCVRRAGAPVPGVAARRVLRRAA